MRALRRWTLRRLPSLLRLPLCARGLTPLLRWLFWTPHVPVGAPSVPTVPALPPAAVAPAASNPAVGSSPQAVSATTGGPGPGESGGATAPMVPASSAAVPPTQRPSSPGRRQHRPHSSAPRDERERSRRRHDSPQRRDVPPPLVPAASAAAPGNCMRLLWIPPVAGIEFVTVEEGPVMVQYPSLLPVGRAPPAAALPVQTLVGPRPSAEVPEASQGQLWRLSEGLQAVHLIQVYGHAALSQGVSLDGGPRDECLNAADRLAELLAPMLAAPARGGVAGVGQLGTALRGMRRFLRAGTAVDLIGATTVAVRKLHRSLTGLLAVLDADQM
ncbi:unnamed protein product [Closterium sp. Naga37s-1]|nr:unnamed protein product [Closterium sp. Naga37s-1]